MKNLLITFILVILSFTSFSQNCIDQYDKIKATSFQEFNLDTIENRLKIIDNNQRTCKINISTWKIIIGNWDVFKRNYSAYDDIKEKNHSDKDRIEEKWDRFKNLLHNYEDQLFRSRDPKLITAIKRVDTSVTEKLTKSTNFIDSLISQESGKVTNNVNTESKKQSDRVIDSANENTKVIIIRSDFFIRKQETLLKEVKSLYQLDSTIKNSINISAYDHNIYGISYLNTFKTKNNSSLSTFAMMLEVVASLDSFDFKNTGVFLSGGVQSKSLLFLAGLGYFDNQSSENISWKGTVMYFPKDSKFGFGASYSPLTKAGILMGYKLNKKL